MHLQIYPFFSILFLLLACKTQKAAIVAYESEYLRVEKLSDNTFVHISYLNTEDFGKVACNGMIVIDAGEAIVFDTPTNDAASIELINWAEKKSKSIIKAVVVTHFHADCLGGLAEFHKKGIPSYANQLTIDLVQPDSATAPQNGFDNYLELNVGKQKVINTFLGEGHTKDNIVSYFPAMKTLFGGCLIKSQGAGKGYLGDANVKAWSNTVERVKSKFGNAAVVIPGHGKTGGTNLLDYTIELFKDAR